MAKKKAKTKFETLKYVLYLTPAEQKMWEEIVNQYADVGIPSLKGDLKVAQLFVDAGLIGSLNGIYRGSFNRIVDPNAYHVVPIPKRDVCRTSDDYLTIVRAIQAGEYEPVHSDQERNHFKAWLTAKFGKFKLNVATTASKMWRYNPKRTQEGWGNLYPYVNGIAKTLISVAGFESVLYKSVKEAAKRMPLGITRNVKGGNKRVYGARMPSAPRTTPRVAPEIVPPDEPEIAEEVLKIAPKGEFDHLNDEELLQEVRLREAAHNASLEALRSRMRQELTKIEAVLGQKVA